MLKIIAELKKTGRIAAINEIIPYAGVIGLESFEDDDGIVTVIRHCPGNIGNTVLPALHGGVVGALLEQAAIVHLLWETDVVSIPKIINLSIDYLRPCRPADTFARGTLVKQGRRIANLRVEAWQSDPGKPAAIAHAHFLIN